MGRVPRRCGVYSPVKVKRGYAKTHYGGVQRKRNSTMKNNTRLVASLAFAAVVAAGYSTASAQSKPIIITHPAVQDGSNWSRAPFPAARQFNDVKGPDGQAIDALPPNTPSSNPEPTPPPARVAILQRTPAPAVVGDPGLLPTGRTTITVSSAVDAQTFAPTIRSAALASREQVIADIEARMKTSDTALDRVRRSAKEMSADGRRQFSTADDNVKARERELKKSLKAARKANDADWMAAREKLAADYEAYGAALGQVDMTSGAMPAR